MDSDLKFLNAFNKINLIGPQALKKIKALFGSYQKAWKAPAKSFQKAGIKGKLLQNIQEKRPEINPEKEFQLLRKYSVRILTPQTKSYPKLLKEIYNPPQILYYLGNLDALSEFSLAVVGSRRYSAYGKETVDYFTKELAVSGLTIISGLALGIDSLAHKAALEASGKTVGVLACGLDQIYPVSNRQLAKNIIKSGGAILSEYPLGTPPLRHHFPYRNRIISGISLGTLVIEATLKSGSLITANHALEQNREIFAIPGNIFSPRSEGTNHLIKLGAKLVTQPQDILIDLEIKDIKAYKETKQAIGDTKEEKTILSLLKESPLSTDKLVKALSLPVADINAILTIMEMKGQIKNLGGGIYGLKR